MATQCADQYVCSTSSGHCIVRYTVIPYLKDSASMWRATQTGGLHMQRPSSLASLGAAALAPGPAGCLPGFTRDRPDDGGITLRMTMWSSSPEHLALFDEIAEEFMAENGAVTNIEFESLTLDQLDMVLTTGMTAGDAPDLTWLPVESSLEYIDAGALLDARPTLSDRKSTRLNSSHVAISYAVFCLKKKTHTHQPSTTK